MLKVAEGDRDAFEALYLRLAPAVYRLALCVAGDRGEAETVTQDVFAELWSQAPSFDTSLGTARAWAMSITHRRAAGAAPGESAATHVMAGLRAPLAQRPSDALSRWPSTAPNESAAPDAELDLGAATHQQRLVIALAYFGRLTPDEVARALHVPAPTVTAQLRDGLRRLCVNAAPPHVMIREAPRRPTPVDLSAAWGHDRR